MVAVVPDGTGGARLRPLSDDGVPAGPVEAAAELGPALLRWEQSQSPRWLWASTAAIYPRALAAGVRVGRCHDVELTEALLLGHEGRWGEPRSVAAMWARRTGAPVPPDPPAPGAPTAAQAAAQAAGQALLFELPPAPPPAAGFDPLAALIEGYADQRARIDAMAPAARFRLLVAAESAGALLAAEMGHDGLPWRADIHDELLLELLGEPSPVGGPPRRLAELTEQITAAFGGARVHPESPADVLRAFARAGFSLPSTRAWVLRQVDHPAVALLLEFKELHRLWTAHGWAWLAAWVREGRFHPEYVPAGVVSGRWATRGGGALQIPKVVRRAVVADDGWVLVVADAGQLEPRVLAAVAGDDGLVTAAGSGDLYAALAADAFGGDRARAKLALLGAMYGQTGGSAVPALVVLRARFPAAWEYVERAARAGEAGGLVRSWLGRTCPPPPPRAMSPEQARSRGRFTRNFVIQATAAEWALTLLAALRTHLAASPPPAAGAPAASAASVAHLVFFQHDEVVVHCPAEQAPAVVEAVHAAGERAGRLLFGSTPVRFPLDVSVVRCYADAA